jgi:hypothetical protein
MQIARHADVKAAGMAAHDVGPSPFGYHREKKLGPSTPARRIFIEKETPRSPSLRMTEF